MINARWHPKISGIPRTIAGFLGLPDHHLYTGHCFRRTSATWLADSDADLTSLKRHGGWKSSAVAESYIEGSIQNKIKVARTIVSGEMVGSSSSTLATESFTTTEIVDATSDETIMREAMKCVSFSH